MSNSAYRVTRSFAAQKFLQQEREYRARFEQEAWELPVEVPAVRVAALTVEALPYFGPNVVAWCDGHKVYTPCLSAYRTEETNRRGVRRVTFTTA